MSVAFYMDVHVSYAITQGLRLRGVDVITAQEDDATRFADPDLLDRAMKLERVLFTQDRDFLREAAERQQSGKAFAGVIYAHQAEVTIGRCLNDLEMIAKAANPEDIAAQVVYLPLGQSHLKC